MYLDLERRARRRSSVQNVRLRSERAFLSKARLPQFNSVLQKRLLGAVVFFVFAWYLLYNFIISSNETMSGGADLVDITDIDIVYSFVNGSDPEWFRSKRQYSPASVDSTADEENAANRYRDNDELKFSLRSLEKYLTWARNIYIVVAMESQVPTWLNTSHPQIRIVYHRDIFTNLYRDHLPTFNSQAIEYHIYNIKGLSENFIYLNDDFMLGKEIKISDFYTPERGIKIYQSWKLNQRTEFWGDIYHSVPQLFEQNPLRRISHLPHFFTKRIMREVFTVFKTEFDKTSANRFRTPGDVQLAFFYYTYIIGDPLQKNKYEKIRFTDKLQYLEVDASWYAEEQLGYIISNPSSFICLQDKGGTEAESEKVSFAISGALDSMYPDPSSFEKKEQTGSK